MLARGDERGVVATLAHSAGRSRGSRARCVWSIATAHTMARLPICGLHPHPSGPDGTLLTTVKAARRMASLHARGAIREGGWIDRPRNHGSASCAKARAAVLVMPAPAWDCACATHSDRRRFCWPIRRSGLADLPRHYERSATCGPPPSGPKPTAGEMRRKDRIIAQPDSSSQLSANFHC